MKRIALILIAIVGLPAADVLTVDPAGTVIVAGTTPAAPAAGEVRIGAGALKTGGTVNVGSTAASVSSTTGALTVAGGLGVGGAIYGNGPVTIVTSGNRSIAGAPLGASLEIMSGGGTNVPTDSAYLTFHRPGSFAAHLGIDTDNILKFGGWSLPAYRVLLGDGYVNNGPVVFANDLSVGNLTISRSSQATASEMVRGDDPRLSNSRLAAGGDAATVGGMAAAAFVPISSKNQANGVASLDGSGNVPASQLNNVPVGAITAFYAGIANAGVVAVTSATTATINRMHHITGLGADYAIVLPAAASNPGAVMGFVVKDYAQASAQYVLDAGGSVRIAGRVRYLTLLHTNIALLMSDGSSWLPLVLNLDSPWISYVQPITATVTAPTKATANRIESASWRRAGSSLEMRFSYQQSQAGGAGSGYYLYPIPKGVIDPSHCVSGASNGTMDSGSVVGNAYMMHYGSNQGFGVVRAFDSTRLMIMMFEDAGNTMGSNSNTFFHLGMANTVISFQAAIPIAYW